ncbi:M28 family peptidase [candidate division CSSED10-310 bacterium]|uniref:M28 family peptidase n=1 Tax=candidate division CSSED10-310 bacterium TaxID=2855610 RepID=A0ABV6YS83_UNCC1
MKEKTKTPSDTLRSGQSGRHNAAPEGWEVLKKYARESLELTRKIIEQYPARRAGSDQCRETAELLKDELQQYCDTTTLESFEFHPNAFLGFLKVLAVTYVVSTGLLFLGGGWVLLAALIYSLGLGLTISQFVFYRETFDPFYAKARGYNVFGVIDPSREIKQQIIIGGHHDSARVFTFLASEWQKYYAHRIVAAMSFIILACLGSWIWGIYTLFSGDIPGFAATMKYLVLIGLVFVLPLYFFVGERMSPGAGDNLISSAIAVKLGKFFGQAKQKGTPYLKNTRLIILSTDAEESGLRGARAYVEKHRPELLSLPTYFFNLESIYSLDHIQFLTSDLNGIIKLSEKMARQGQSIATECGYKSSLFHFTFGGGATDAAEFASSGIEATTLLGMPTHLVREGLVYHTRDDTVDNIDPRAVEAFFTITQRYIKKKDQDI